MFWCACVLCKFLLILQSDRSNMQVEGCGGIVGGSVPYYRFIAPVCEGTLVIFICLCHQLLDIMMLERRRTVIGVEYLFMCIASCFCSSLRPLVKGEA